MAKESDAPADPFTPRRPQEQPRRPMSHHPEFGKPSPIRPVHHQSHHSSNPFNIPKPNQQRPEHHRQQPRPQNPAHNGAPQYRPPTTPGPNSFSTPRREAFDPFKPVRPSAYNENRFSRPVNSGAVEIRRPENFTFNTPRAPKTFFASKPSAVKMSNASKNLRNFVDLTGEGGFTPSARSRGPGFGSMDVNGYVDTAKANENIKALLEGAFEDEDEKQPNETESENEEDDDEEEEEEEEEEEDDGTVEGLKVKLLPHQREGVNWMCDKETGRKKTKGVLPKGGILADDMGLGKTVQAIALMLSNRKPADGLRRPFKTTLVVAPLALIKQWESEISDKVENSHRMRVLVYHGNARAKGTDKLEDYDVVITTYGTLTSEHGAKDKNNKKSPIFSVYWYRIILDEAHTIKNRNAKATQAAYSLDAEYRWCLSGTPMQNNLEELQSLIKFLRIKPFNDLAAWKEQIMKPIANGRGGLAIERLQIYLKIFMKRRTKDVLKQNANLKPSENGQKKSSGFHIVKREVIKVEADFMPGEMNFYQRLEQRTENSLEKMMGGEKVDYAGALVLLLRLRQSCNHPDLVKSDLAQDKDVLLQNGHSGSQKPAKNDELDSMADLFGALSVVSKKCDICQMDLKKEEASGGNSRCKECEVARRSPEVESDDDDIYLNAGDDDNKILPSTKIRRLMKILRRESSDHKFIVFSVFTSMLDKIEPFLKRTGIGYARYDGGMRNDHREASLNKLRNNSGTRVLLCSLRAGALGLNLTAASRVVILEPFWNPFVEEQAIDRVHRLNQTVDVKIYKMIIKGTVEERIIDLQDRKRELANVTIEGKTAAAKLTMKDMMALFGKDAEARYNGDRDLDLNQTTKLLNSGADSNSGSTYASETQTSSSRDRSRQQAKRTSRGEDSVYGRRWALGV
ncbi:uncharacterized protein An11g06990 [Aspergillus niger]|uniref:Contig An11c0240, genomic contig n=2 Tax=Aspergillus niger TaxID=5061 RepID=A2QWZ3_ASPNC|nr:uncharacterized protein An11g06990 [Aspergillus niger]CAK96995.1 unnamed protein product [Aspergillus niger]